MIPGCVGASRVGDAPAADATEGEAGPDERRAGDPGDEAEAYVLAALVRVEGHHDGARCAESDADGGDEPWHETASREDAGDEACKDGDGDESREEHEHLLVVGRRSA